MPVTITMRVTETSVDAANNRSYVNVVVTANYNGGSFNRNDPPLTVTLDGVSETVGVDFNAGQATSGSEVIYNQIWYVGHNSDGSKILYYSASYVTGVSSGTVTTSGSLVLTPTSGGSSGGGTPGGDNTGGGNTGGDNTGGDNTGGGNTGGDSGGSSGDGSQYYLPVKFIVPEHSYIQVYLEMTDGGSPIRVDTIYWSCEKTYTSANNIRYYRFTFHAEEGYTLVGSRYNGSACDQGITFSTSANPSTITLETLIEAQTYSLRVTTASEVAVSLYRIESDAGSIGTVTSRSTLYYGDVILVGLTCVDGYLIDKATANGAAITDGDEIIVTGDLRISVTAKKAPTLGIVYIDARTAHEKYQAFIEDGTTHHAYLACVDIGSGWEELI